MSRVVVALINQNPDIKESIDRIHQREGFLKKQLEALKKNAMAARKKNGEENNPDWEQIEKILKDQGMLDDYNEATHYLAFSIERNCIELIERGGENPFMKIFGGFFNDQ